MTSTARGQLALIAVVQVLAMSCWFAASAVQPSLQAEWDVSSVAGTWLTVSVQLGFVVGALGSALLSLPDLWPPHRLVAASAAVVGISTVSIGLFVDSLGPAIVLRFLAGVALAGVYPPGMKLMASWFIRGRGLAMGVLIGSLTLGSSVPQLLSAVTVLPWRGLLVTAGGLALVGALVAAALVRPGPHLGSGAPFDPHQVLALARQRPARLAISGYLGHMWELYAMWAWIPAYLVASQAARGADGSATTVGMLAFSVIGVAGVIGCLLGGWLGDRHDHAGVAAGAMVVSGSCALLAALLFGAHPLVLVPLLWVWGASVIADSGLFSTCLSQVVDQRYVGTALATQTALGFLLTAGTIQAVPLVVEATSWSVAFGLLAVGPAFGAVAMLRLRRT